MKGYATSGSLAGAIAALAALVAFAPPSGARTRPAGDLWLRAESPSFTLLGDVPENRLREIAVLLETFRDSIERLHPGSRPSPRETVVYVFADAAGGRRYTPAPAGGGHPLGVNPPFDVPNFVTVAAPRDHPPLEVLYHGYAHQFLDDNFPRLPLTVTEGLAEFYSRFSATPEGTLIGIANTDHLHRLREGPFPPLAHLFSLDSRSQSLAEGPAQATFLAGSWAMMHYLVSRQGDRRAALPKFLEMLQRGAPAADATRQAFGVALDRLEQEVAAYVAGDRHLPLRIPPAGREAGASPGAPPPPSIRVRRMERDEVLAALGEAIVFADVRRAADAEAHFHAALEMNPGQPHAYAGLGRLRTAQDRPAEAIPFLEKAIALEPDALSCYLLATLLYRTGRPATPAAGGATPPSLSRVRDLLGRAIAMRPRLAAPYVLLGATHIEPDGDVAAGIELLQKAHAMLPARTDILTNLVYLLLRNGDLIRARAVVDGPLAASGDPAALEKGRREIATFQEHLEARQSLYLVREKPEEKARRQAWEAREVQLLREALARTTDPGERAKIEARLKSIDLMGNRLTHNDAVAIFNEAVDHANRRDFARAIALLEGLLPRVGEVELRQSVEAMLARFRQDAVRLAKPAE